VRFRTGEFGFGRFPSRPANRALVSRYVFSYLQTAAGGPLFALTGPGTWLHQYFMELSPLLSA